MYLDTVHEDLCAIRTHHSPLPFGLVAIGNYVSVGERQLYFIVQLAQPGRKQKGPGEWEGIELKILQLWLLDLNERETPCGPYTYKGHLGKSFLQSGSLICC